jgi:hypothetical protein
MERVLGRTVAFGVPLVSVLGAIAVGAVAGMGSALLVLAAGALIGAIGLIWASVRTLSGDAPLAADFEELVTRLPSVDALAEEKGRLLRALKDLESERALGKIDEADYRTIVARYRDEAKVVMRKMDMEVAPFREEAERIALEHLRKRGLGPTSEGDPPETKAAPKTERTVCEACAASNEWDAAFCKQCGSRIGKEPGGAHR